MNILSLLLAAAVIAEHFLLPRFRKKKKRCFRCKLAETIAELYPLPKNPNWNEINTFLKDCQYGYRTPDSWWFMHNWERQPAVRDFKVSKKSVATLQCLSKDMKYIFHKVYIEYDRVSEEDNESKYTCVRELLEIKYSKLSPEIREKIYEQFIYSYKHHYKKN